MYNTYNIHIYICTSIYIYIHISIGHFPTATTCVAHGDNGAIPPD